MEDRYVLPAPQPRLRDHCREEGRTSVRAREYLQGNCLDTAGQLYVGLFPRVVTACTRPVQDQASTNPKWRGELNMKFLLGLLAGVREREGERGRVTFL